MAFFNVILFLLNIAVNAFPISHGNEAGTIKFDPLVILINSSLCFSFVITDITTDVSMTIFT